MKIKDIWNIFDEKVLSEDANLKKLLFVLVFIWLIIIIYTARHAAAAQSFLESWINFTIIFSPAGLVVLMISSSIAERLKIDVKIFMLWILFLVLGNLALSVLFFITVESVIWIIDLFGF